MLQKVAVATVLLAGVAQAAEPISDSAPAASPAVQNVEEVNSNVTALQEKIQELADDYRTWNDANAKKLKASYEDLVNVWKKAAAASERRMQHNQQLQQLDRQSMKELWDNFSDWLKKLVRPLGLGKKGEDEAKREVMDGEEGEEDAHLNQYSKEFIDEVRALLEAVQSMLSKFPQEQDEQVSEEQQQQQQPEDEQQQVPEQQQPEEVQQQQQQEEQPDSALLRPVPLRESAEEQQLSPEEESARLSAALEDAMERAEATAQQLAAAAAAAAAESKKSGSTKQLRGPLSPEDVLQELKEMGDAVRAESAAAAAELRHHHHHHPHNGGYISVTTSYEIKNKILFEWVQKLNNYQAKLQDLSSKAALSGIVTDITPME